MGKSSTRTFIGVLLCTFIGQVAAQAERVTSRQAETVAQNWLAEGQDRLGDSLDTTIAEIENHTNYYAVQLSPEGFLIVASDSLVEPIIAFSDKGYYSADSENPLTVMLNVDMENRLIVADAISVLPAPADADVFGGVYAETQQAALRWNELLSEQFKSDRATSISDVRIAPFALSQWSQGSAQSQYCYNYYTPSHYVAGCVAIAMAQVMRYFEYPADGIGQITKTIRVNGSSQSAVTRGGDGSGGAYNWSQMPLAPSTATYNADHWRMIGALCYDAGVAAQMSYSSGGSSAYYGTARSAMTNIFKFSNAEYRYSSSGLNAATRQLILKPNLAAKRPVMLGVRRSGGGHAIVCDGFGYSSGTEYHHMNLGWGGYYDAWYNLPTVDAGSYTYTMVDAAVYNMYTSGDGELIAGRILDGSSQPVSGALVTASGGYTANTDSKGYYAIRVPASATYNLTATKSSYADGARNSVAVGSSGYSSVGNYWGANMTMSKYVFSFKAFALTNNIALRWTDPMDVGMPVATALVRRATSDYPANSSDGTQIYLGTNTVYTDNDLTVGQEYYYTIWVYDGSGWTNPPVD